MLINSLIASALLAIALSAPAPPSCPSGWKLYQPRNVCFFEYHSTKTWQQAREKCQESGADLLQIEDEAMNEWVKATRREKDFAHWIGVSDQDLDGKFEYIDGHDLVTASSNLGFRNITVWPNEGACVFQRRENKGWGTANCQAKLKYLCERPQGMKGDSDKRCAAGWYLYQAEMKCISSSGGLKSWADARKHCQESGGDLLVVGDKNKEEFVKDKREAGWSHWIGVKYSQENKEYELVNGQKLYPESKGLGKWGSFRNYNSRKDNFCVYQQYYNVGWGNSICSAELKFFCGKSLYPKELPQTTPAPPSCPSGWKLYQPRNVCFFEYHSLKPWQQAREKCQESGADLLQIEDEAMNEWVKATRREKDFAHWIGVGDQDLDGKFEYIDGHDLITASSNLGFRNITVWPNEGACVFQRRENKGWGTANCQAKLKYLCERPQGMKGDPDKRCPGGWYLYQAEMKCISSSGGLKSWADARKHCQESGGDLLVVGDKNKEEFIKDKREAGWSHWIGVKYSQENKEYELVNGQKLYPESKGLGKWGSFRNYNSKKDNFCVYQQYYNVGWGNSVCSAALKFFCGKSLYPKEMPQTKEEDSDNVNDAQQRDEDVVEDTMAQEENSEEEFSLENDAVTEDLEREEPDNIPDESAEESESIPEGYNEDSNVSVENGDAEVEEDGDYLENDAVTEDLEREEPDNIPDESAEESESIPEGYNEDSNVSVENGDAEVEEDGDDLENDAVTEDLEREEPDNIPDESAEESESIPEGYNEDSNVSVENGDVDVEEDGDELDKLSVDLDSNMAIDFENVAVVVEEVDDDSGESENKIEVVKLDSKPKNWKPFDFLPVYYVSR